MTKTAPKWTKAQKKPIPVKGAPSGEPRPPKLLACSLLSEVEPEYIKWLWYPYIPAGKLTIIEGDPGLGKSWIGCAIAKAIAGGLTLPGMKHALPPAKVLLAGAEDGVADTLVPRLIAMKADLGKIFHIDDIFILDKHGLRSLESTMVEYAVAIVFIDPLVAYLGGKMDMNKANEVREVMEGLKQVSERTGAAIVVIRHLRKAGGKGKDIYAGLGSIDFTAAARSVLMVTETKKGENIISHIKHNNTARGQAMSYAINKGPEDPEHPGQYGPGDFEWTGWYKGADEEATMEPQKVCTKSKRKKCEAFLFDLLRDGSKSASECQSLLLAAGFKMSTIKLAKKGLVGSDKQENGWIWYLTDRGDIDHGREVSTNN